MEGCGGREEIAVKKGEGCGGIRKRQGVGEGKNRQKMGKRAGWETLAGEDNPEKDGKY